MRCKTIKIDPVKQVSDSMKERDVIGEYEEMELKKANFKSTIERIERETKYATKQECEQQLVGLEGMYKKKFQDLKEILKVEDDLEQIIEAWRIGTQSESLNILKNRLNSADELKHMKLKCKNLSIKLEEQQSKTVCSNNEVKHVEEMKSHEMTELRRKFNEMQSKYTSMDNEWQRKYKELKEKKENEIRTIINNGISVVNKNNEDS